MFFLELSCFFDDPVDVGNLICGSSACSKSSLNIWKFTVYVLLKPGLENFEHYFAGMWNECNCAVVWTFFGIALLWDWNENWPFPVLWPLLSFPNVLAFSFFCLYLFFIYLFLLYNIVLVLPYINMNLPRMYTCSPSWTPSPTSLPVPSLASILSALLSQHHILGFEIAQLEFHHLH